jgi:electron transport complex protein RnfD
MHAPVAIPTVMSQVLLALIPGILVYSYFCGWLIIIQIALASVFALGFEALLLWLRKRPLKPFLSDGSALVTAFLLALALPPLVPWWVTLVAVGFAIVFAKHVYGGLGYNPFNPAMVGFAVALISFPRELTTWPALDNPVGLWDSLRIIFIGMPGIDAVSAATPLDSMKTQLSQNLSVAEIRQAPLFGYFGAKGWEFISLAYLLGGLWLVYRKIIGWQIPLGFLGSLFIIATFFSYLNPEHYPSPFFHLFSGAVMLGAFFIATDPVSAATSNQGKLIYAIGIGILVYVIRTWGGYPDGVAFAVLLMNMSVPMLDYYTRPRVFGR